MMSLTTDPGAPWLCPGQAPGSSAQALVGCPGHHLTAGQGFFEEGLQILEQILHFEGRNFEGLHFEGLDFEGRRSWDC